VWAESRAPRPEGRPDSKSVLVLNHALSAAYILQPIVYRSYAVPPADKREAVRIKHKAAGSGDNEESNIEFIIRIVPNPLFSTDHGLAVAGQPLQGPFSATCEKERKPFRPTFPAKPET